MHTTEFIESYMDAWNSRDPERILSHMSPDAVYRDIPYNTQHVPEQMLVSLKEFFSSYRYRYELIGEVQTSESALAFQYRMYPLRQWRAGDKSTCYRGAEFMTMSGDAAINITDYYDLPEEPAANKYAKSGLSEEHLLKFKQRLDRVMKSQMVFLRSDLTLPKLADIVGCSVNHLSQVINSGFGESFFDYLNHYRIEHARELLAQPGNKSSAILNTAFEVGFNSNSAFYAAFKKFVGQTPAQYRKAHLKNQL